MSESSGDALQVGLDELSQLQSALGVTEETFELATVLYRNATSSDDVSLVGRGITPVAAACLLISCRQTGDVRTADEIAAELPDHILAKRIHATVKYLSTQLELGLVVASPHDYVDRIASDIGADEDDTEFAKNIIDAIQENGVGLNQAPRTVAATAFYYVGAHDRGHGRYTQREIADAADVSTLTVRNNYQSVSEVLSEYDLNELQP